MLAQAVYAQGRVDEADELCRRDGGGRPRDDDIVTQVIWRGVQAKVPRPRERRCADAEELARGRGRARRADRLAFPSR